MSEDRSSRAFSTRAWILAGLLLAGTCTLVLHPLSTSPATQIHDPRVSGSRDAGRADVRLHAWVLASGTRALLGDSDRGFFDANIFHPDPATLTYSEHLLGVQLLFAPILIVTQRLALALNLWILSTFLLSGLAAWWVTYRWFGSHLAGALAGVAFAFAPWRLYTLVHVKLLSVQYFPLIAWAAIEGRERPRWRVWAILAASCFLEAASCFYLGYLGFLFAGVLVTACLAFGGPGRARYLAFSGSAFAAAAIAMIPLSLPYANAVRSGAMYSPVNASTRTLFDYLYPYFPGAPEMSWGLWWTLPPLALVGCIQGLASQRHRILAGALGGVALLGAWLALGPHGELLGIPIGFVHELAAELVPGWSSFRVWSRFAILTWVAVSLLAVVPFVPLGTRFELPPRARAGLAGVLLVGLIFFASRVPIGAEPEPTRIASIQPNLWLLHHGEGDPVVHVPREYGRTDAEYMYLSTIDWSPMLNGYGAYLPPTIAVIDPLVRALPAKPARRALESLELVRWIVLHTDRLTDDVVRTWDEALGPALRSAGERHRIYELPYTGSSAKLLEHDPERTLLGTPREALAEEDLFARVSTAYPKLSSRPAGPLWIWLNVRNRSERVWPAVGLDPDGLVGVHLELRDASGAVIHPGRFERLPYDLAPRAHARVRVRIRAPAQPGSYSLVPCLSQSGRTARPTQEARRCDESGAISLDVRGDSDASQEAVAEKMSPNVLLFTIDTLRADHVGAYGYRHETTPEIDRLASQGLVFETAYAPMGTTCPSHATLFTSRHPLAHGVVRNGLPMLAGEQTLAERLADAGYRTAGFVSSFPVSRQFGFDQGFDIFDDDFTGSGEAKLAYRKWGGANVSGKFDRAAEQTAGSVLRWLETADRDTPWFVWVHLFDPHGPYRPPAEHAARFERSDASAAEQRRARYDGEIRYADSQLGRIADAFEKTFGAENLLLVITSDHGEGLFDHGWGAHNLTIYEEEVRVPLVFRWPGKITAGERRVVPAHLLDVTPTLLGLLEIQQDGLDGVDLSNATGADRPLFLLRPQRAEADPEGATGLGVRLGSWKLIQPEKSGGVAELYDLDADPRERSNVATRHPGRVRELEGLLQRWKLSQLAWRSEREGTLSDHEREGLRALGYLDESR